MILAMITTIIPTYKRPKLLRRAILSALGQTVSDIQVQVYDDASNDETEEVVRECMQKDGRLKYHRHPNNVGLLKNYQFGLSQVKTEHFSFLSDDDVLFPWFYEETLAALQRFPQCAFAAGSAIIMTEEGKVVRVPIDLWKREGVFAPPEGLLEMISKYPIPSCILFHRKVLETTAIDMQNALTWDWDYLLQCATKYACYISKRPCGIYLHHASYSNSKGFDAWDYSLRRMIERLNVESGIKKAAAELILRDLKGMYRPLILRYLYERKFQEAYDLARQEGVLLWLAKAAMRMPAVVHLILWVRALKHLKRQWTFRRYSGKKLIENA
jgi:glycosyltransferase involved in cell wall biosynthesis